MSRPSAETVDLTKIRQFRKEYPEDVMIIHDLSASDIDKLKKCQFLLGKINRPDLGILAVLTWCRRTFATKTALFERLQEILPDIHITEFVSTSTYARLDQGDFFPQEIADIKKNLSILSLAQMPMSYCMFYKGHQIRVFPPMCDAGKTFTYVNGHRVLFPAITDDLAEIYKIVIVLTREMWKCLILGEIRNFIPEPTVDRDSTKPRPPSSAERIAEKITGYL